MCSDNVATVFYINHQGGTRSSAALQVAYNLLVWAQSNLLSICAVYLPGRLNSVADALSRGKVSGRMAIMPRHHGTDLEDIREGNCAEAI